MSQAQLIWVSYYSFVGIGMAGGLLNIAWTYMQDTFGVSLDSLGILLSAGIAGQLLAAFMSGVLIGRVGIRSVLLGGAVIASFGFLGYGLAPTWILLLGIAFVTGMGKGTLDAGMNNFVSANYGTTQMNLLHASWGIGLTAAPMFVTLIVVRFDQSWRMSYIMAAALLSGVAIALFITLDQWHIGEQVDEDSSVPLKTASIQETIQRPVVIVSLLLFFAYGGIEIGTGQLANTLLVESRQVAEETASTWVSMYWGSFTIGRMLISVLALRFGDRRLMQMSMALMILGAMILTLNTVVITSLLGLLLIGFGLAAMFPLLISQTPKRVGLRFAPNVIGFQVGFAGLGGAMLPGITGAIAENAGLEVISIIILGNAFLLFFLHQGVIRLSVNKPLVSM